MLMFNKKKLIVISIYISFFIVIPIVKNESRMIEKKIENFESKIFILEKNLLEANLEFQYLSSPAVLSAKIEKNLDQEYNSLHLSQIYLNIDDFKSEQKITSISKNEEKKKIIKILFTKIKNLFFLMIFLKKIKKIKS